MNGQVFAKHEDDNTYSTLDKRDRFLHHLNRVSLTCHAALTIMLIFVALSIALALLGMVTIDSAPVWLWFAVFALSIPEFIAAIISNRLLRNITGSLLDTDLPSSDCIVRRKFSWMYSPDKLEKWLDQMEAHGYSLHRIGKRGRRFYFTKSKGKNNKYCVDFQLMADCKYYITHSQDGWKPFFVTYGSFGRWTIWAKAFDPGEDQKPLNSNNSHMVSHAHRTAIAYSGVLVSIIVLIGAGIRVSMETAFIYGIHNIATVLFLSGLILFSLIQTTARAWLFFRRQRNLSRPIRGRSSNWPNPIDHQGTAGDFDA